MIAIIDYDAGNIKSVQKALEAFGEQGIITRDENMILNADKVILPGVGAFGEAMEKIHKYRLYDVIHEVVDRKTPFLGICLGLQLLFERSAESPETDGLSVLKGEILRIPERKDIKIPHIGWNSLQFSQEGKIFKGVNEESYVYFVHSYYLKAQSEEIVTAKAEYGGTTIHASVEQDNVFACQFHPEKSSSVGMKILQNFLKLT